MGQDGFASLFFGLEGHPDVSQNDDQSDQDDREHADSQNLDHAALFPRNFRLLF